MNCKVLLYYLILLFCTSAIAFGQNTVKLSGNVQNNDGDFLPSADILINDSIAFLTDENGAFRIDLIPQKKYSIKIFYFEHITLDTLVYLPSDTHITFTLPVNFSSTSGVTVSSIYNELEEYDGFAINSINTKDFASRSLEISDVINTTPGISVRQEGGVGSKINYHINGLKGKSIRFFLDEIPLDYFGSSFSINTIPISFIKRIDIYKGVIPAKLGNDALGGAVNLISNKEKNQGEASYSYGSFGTHRASFAKSYRDSTSGITAEIISFYNKSKNNYKVWGDNIYITDPNTYQIKRDLKLKRFHDDFSTFSLKGLIGVSQKKIADKLYVGFLTSSMKKDIQHGPTTDVVYGEAKYQQKVMMPHLIYKKNELVRNLDFNFFGAYSLLTRLHTDTSRNIYDWSGEIIGERTLGGEQRRTLNHLKDQVWITRLNCVYHLSQDHRLTFNTLLTHQTRTENDPIITTKSIGYWSPQILKKSVISLAYTKESFNDKLKTSLFVKQFGLSTDIKKSEYVNGERIFYQNSRQFRHYGAGMTVSFRFNSNVILMMSGERTARLPAPSELLGDGLNVISSSDLKAEISTNLNLGSQIDFFSERKINVFCTPNLFVRNTQNLIQLYQYDLGSFVNTNFEKVLSKGVDLTVGVKSKEKFHVISSTSYLNPLIKSEKDLVGGDNITYNSRLPNIPFFTQNISIALYFRHLIKNTQWSLFWNSGYTGGFYRYSEIIGQYNKDQIPRQWINGTGVSCKLLKMNSTISIDFKNIFNQQAFDNYAVQKPGRALFVKVISSF